MVDGIVGITFWTNDVNRLLSFYRDVLGLTPHSVLPSFVAFHFGEIHLNLGSHSKIKGQANDPYRIMINLGTQDIQNAYEQLLDQGVTFLRPPEHEHWGGIVATFLDPDGNILQLLQQPNHELRK